MFLAYGTKFTLISYGGAWHVRFNGDWNGYSPDFANTASNDAWGSNGGKDGMSFHGTVGIGPYSIVVLSQ